MGRRPGNAPDRAVDGVDEPEVAHGVDRRDEAAVGAECERIDVESEPDRPQQPFARRQIGDDETALVPERGVGAAEEPVRDRDARTVEAHRRSQPTVQNQAARTRDVQRADGLHRVDVDDSGVRRTGDEDRFSGSRDEGADHLADSRDIARSDHADGSGHRAHQRRSRACVVGPTSVGLDREERRDAGFRAAHRLRRAEQCLDLRVRALSFGFRGADQDESARQDGDEEQSERRAE